MAASTSSSAVTAQLSALSADQTVHFRCVATNSRGTTNGSDAQFTVGSAAPSQISVTLNLGDHSKLDIHNVDATAQTVKLGWTAANDAVGVLYVSYTAPFPASVASPDPAKPWGNVAAFDASGSPIGTWWDSAPGGGRVLTTPASATAPTVTTGTASQITANSATVAASAYDLKGQASGTLKFDYGLTAGYGSSTPTQPVTGQGSAGSTPAFSTENHAQGTTSVVVPATGFTNGLLLIDLVASKGTGATQAVVTAPAGRTLNLAAPFFNTSGGGHELNVYSKVAASEVSSTWGFDISNKQLVATLAFSGQSPSSPLRAIGTSSNASSLTCQCPSVNAVQGDLLLYGGFFANGDTASSTTGTERLEANVGTAATDYTLFAYTETASSTGATGVRQITLANAFGNGSDTSMGFMIAIAPANSGGANVAQAQIGGLSGATLYHFRPSLTTTGGTATGNDQTFTTAGAGVVAPNVQITDPPPCISAQGVSFGARVDWGGATTTGHFEYGKTTAYGTSTSNFTASNSSSVVGRTVSPGLAFSTRYHFRAVATNSAGTTTTGDHTFVTKASGTPKFQVGVQVVAVELTGPDIPPDVLGQTGTVIECDPSEVVVAFGSGAVARFDPWGVEAA